MAGKSTSKKTTETKPKLRQKSRSTAAKAAAPRETIRVTEETPAPAWMSTTVRVDMKTSIKQEAKLLEYMSMSKYAWNWTIAEWQWLEMQKRIGNRESWPSAKDIHAIWKLNPKSKMPGIPACIAELAIDKYVTTYMVSIACKHKGPVSTTPRLSGSFRVDKELCKLSPDKKKISLPGVPGISLDTPTVMFDWDDITYVTVRRFTKKGFVLYLVRNPPEPNASTINSMFLDGIDEALEDEDLDMDERVNDGPTGGDRGNDVREDD